MSGSTLDLGELLLHVRVEDNGVASKLNESGAQLDALGKRAKHTGDLWQDSAGKWRNAAGQYATASQKAAHGIDDVGKSAQKTSGMMQHLGGIMAGIGIAAVLKDTIGEASHLNETVSFTQQVFGDSAEGLIEWSQQAADSIGLASSAALDGANTIGMFFQSAGIASDKSAELSKNLVQLAADMASAKDTSVPDALDAITASLRGEQEAIRRYGVTVDEGKQKAEAFALGIGSASGPLSGSAKMLASYNIIMRETAKMHGNFKLTQDDPANSMRRLQAEVTDLQASIGTSLLPTLKELLTAARDTTKWAAANLDVIKSFALIVAAIYAANKAGMLYAATMTAVAGRSAEATAANAASWQKLKGGITAAAAALAMYAAYEVGMAAGDVAGGTARGKGLETLVGDGGGAAVGGMLGGPVGAALGGTEFGQKAVAVLAGAGQNIGHTLSGGLLDGLTGYDVLQKTIADGDEATRLHDLNMKHMEDEKAYGEKILADKESGLLTDKEAIDLLYQAKQPGMDLAALEQARAQNAERLSTAYRDQLTSMNILSGAPDMFRTETLKGKDGKVLLNKDGTAKTRQVALAATGKEVMSAAKATNRYNKDLNADIGVLREQGITTEAMAALLDMEKSKPGTIDKIAGKNAKKMVTGLNAQFKEGGILAQERQTMIDSLLSVWDEIGTQGVDRAAAARLRAMSAYYGTKQGQLATDVANINGSGASSLRPQGKTGGDTIVAEKVYVVDNVTAKGILNVGVKGAGRAAITGT